MTGLFISPDLEGITTNEVYADSDYTYYPSSPALLIPIVQGKEVILIAQP